jgi:hypothetical protein
MVYIEERADLEAIFVAVLLSGERQAIRNLDHVPLMEGTTVTAALRFCVETRI